MKANHKGVNKAIRFIALYYRTQVTIEDWIAVSGMSRRGLHKAFNKSVGFTPYQQLQNVWIAHAKKLLAADNLGTQQVATMCGYRSLNTFHVAFKRVTGISPGQYSSGKARIKSAKNSNSMAYLGLITSSRTPESLIKNTNSMALSGFWA